jgi:tetratricopeptide (TPR) repeat protein
VSGVAAAAAVAALVGLALAGVLAGFRRRDPIPVTPLGDPLLDRRLALERSLEDLEDAREGGALDDAGFALLREETRERLDRIDRAISTRIERETVPQPARHEPSRIPSWAVGVLVAAVVGGVVLSSLARDGEPVTTPRVADAEDPFAFFEERVRAQPDDVAARLDLGRRYLDAGRYDEALEQYRAVLELDSDDAEAHAQIGLLLLFADRPEDALETVDRALVTAPDYPEGLFYRGVILLEGLDRPDDAIVAFERYLEVAPFGAQRDCAATLIEQARGADTSGC